MTAPDVRKTALATLTALEKDRPATLDRLLDDDRAAHREWSRRDRAFHQALVFGVLRSRNRLDWFIRHFSKTPFKKIAPEVKNILRLGTYQILRMDRVPDSAAVNTAVELAKFVAAPWTVKFVNGLLRSVARHRADVQLPTMDQDTVQALSVRKSLPGWLVQRWLARFGREACTQLCDAVNTIPPLSLRTNTLQTTRPALIEALAGSAEKIAPTPHAPEGISLTGLNIELSALPAFVEGKFQVQDEAAQLVGHLLAPHPGQRILDACAGLGGKTGHIGQLIENKGEIVALESIASKLTTLQTEMRRLGISIVKPARHDLAAPPDPAIYGTFDRILLDAPCSGLGVLRRNPDTRWHRTAADLKRYANRQQTFLHHLAPLLKPDGLLVYAVCSMEPEENEGVIHRFLSQNRSFAQADIQTNAIADPQSVIGADRCLRTFPHRHPADGFFAACLEHRK